MVNTGIYVAYLVIGVGKIFQCAKPFTRPVSSSKFGFKMAYENRCSQGTER